MILEALHKLEGGGGPVDCEGFVVGGEVAVGGGEEEGGGCLGRPNQFTETGSTVNLDYISEPTKKI